MVHESLSPKMNKILRCLMKEGQSHEVAVRSRKLREVGPLYLTGDTGPPWTNGAKESRKAMNVPSRCLVSVLFFLDCGHAAGSHSQDRAAYLMRLQEVVHPFLGSGRRAILGND